MIVAKIKVTDNIAYTVYRKVIPACIIGAQVEFEYADDIWQGLHKTVVFKGVVTKDVITDAEVVTIPAEVVAKRGYPLQVGVYGVDMDGNLAIPTIWAALGNVRDAAKPSGDTTTHPTLPVWAQIQAMIGNLNELDTDAKNNLVDAVNEAMTKGGGAGSMDLRVADGYVQYSTDGGMTWTNLISMAELKGADGKSAYQYAVEGGYTGTEAEFSAKLEAEIPTVDSTLAKSGQAADAAVVGNRLSAISEEIANLKTSGLTTAQINALDGMFKVAAYDDSKDVSGAYAAFKSAFGLVDSGVTAYTITADLVNVTSSNSATSITDGESYTATLTAADGYALDTVSVLMGGVDVTADVYADGVISIPAVTGNVEIVAHAVQVGEVAPGLSEDSLSAYFDFRNVAILASEHYAATKGVDGAYFSTPYDTTVNDDKGIMLDNGTYGGGNGGGFNINTEHFTFGILFYTTETRCAVLPVNIGSVWGSDVKVSWRINYLDSSGTSTSAAKLSENVFSAGKYVFVAYRTTAEQADIFVDGSLKLTEKSGALTDFATWAEPGKIRASKNFGNGQVTALAYYDRALSDAEIVELGEYFKTLEVRA